MWYNIVLIHKYLSNYIKFIITAHLIVITIQVKITVPKHGQVSSLLREVSNQTGVDKDKVGVI